MPQHANGFKKAAIEFAIVSAIPFSFGLLFLSQSLLPLMSLLDHGRLVLGLLFALYLSRYLLTKICVSKTWYTIISATLLSSFFICSIVYYLLIYISLTNWSRVITFEILITYLGQMESLLDVAGISPQHVIFFGLIILLGCFYFWFKLVQKTDWLWQFKTRKSNSSGIIVILGVGAFCVNDAIAFRHGYFATSGEPLSITFFSELAKTGFQSTSVSLHELEKNDEQARKVRLSYKPAIDTQKKNVILIVVDALRPDHMSSYNYERKTTPNIDDLTKKYGKYQASEMHAICNESSCGLFGIVSSKYLHEFSYRPFTLQETLRKNNYVTRMILSGDHTNFYGLRDVYGDVDDYFDGSQQKDRYLNDDQLILDHLAKLDNWSGRPEFMQFHIMATHGIGQKMLPEKEYIEQTNYYSKKVDLDEMRSNKWNRVVNFYDSGVWTADHYVGEIIEILRQKNYLENAIVVITADHGEMLGEHGVFGHSKTVYQPVLKIPFILLSFNKSALKPNFHKIEGASSQVDIAPTILNELGIAIPSNWSGKPLQNGRGQDLIYFQSKIESGFFVPTKSGELIKYWRNSSNRGEFAYRVSSDLSEERNSLYDFPTDIKKEWLLRLP